MNEAPIWLPPLLAMFGSLIVVVITSLINTRTLSNMLDAFRNEIRAEIRASTAETRAEIAQLKAEFTEVRYRLTRIEDHIGIRAPR